MKKRLVSLLLCLVMIACMLPATAFAGSGRAMQLGAGGVANGDRIYLGKYGDFDDVPWVVIGSDEEVKSTLDANPSSLFLFSKYALGREDFRAPYATNKGYYNYCTQTNTQSSSNLKLAIEALYNGMGTALFTDLERGAIKQTTLAGDSMFTGMADLDAYLFPLSLAEAESIGAGNNLFKPIDIGNNRVGRDQPIKTPCWLRTSYPVPAGNYPGSACYYVTSNGTFANIEVDWPFGARPAFNLDLSAVLFTSAAAKGKSLSGMEAGLTAVSTAAPSDWKLTLKDSARAGFSITTIGLDSAAATVDYAGAKTGAKEYISAIIEDGGSVAYYGRVLQLDGTTNGASGTVRIDIPAGVTLDADTRLLVFNEQFNGDRLNLNPQPQPDDPTLPLAYTDYASELRAVTAPAAPSASVGDVTVSGTVGTAIAPADATVTLTSSRFNALAANADVSGWFTNLPAGLTAKIKTAVAQYDNSATVTFSGTPAAASAAAMAITLPAASVVGNADIAVTSNASARWAVAEIPVTVAPSGSTSFVKSTATGDAVFTISSSTPGFNATNNYESSVLDNSPLALGEINAAAGGRDGSIKDGSIVLTINKAKLNTLGVGTHTLVVALKGGYYGGRTVSSTITVRDAGGSDGRANPSTGV